MHARRSAFDDYLRGVFAEPAVRARLLRTNRARRLLGLGRRPASSAAEQRWEGEGGASR